MAKRPTIACALVFCLAAACGGAAGDSDQSTNAESSSTEPAESTTPPVTTATSTTSPTTSISNEPATTSATTSTTTSTTTVVVDSPRPTIEELGDLAADGEISTVELAVSEFAAVFTVEVEGAIPVAFDPRLSVDPSSVIELLDGLRPELTDTQRQQIDDALAIDSSTAVVLTNEDLVGFESGGSGSNETATPVTIELDTEWQGLRSPDPVVDPRLVAQLQGAQAFVMGGLGGTLPRFTARFVGPEERRTNQANWLGWARTRTADDGERTCDITIVNFLDGTAGAEKQLGTVIHEFFHCWHGQNFTGSVEDYWWSPRWVKEGLAKWVEDQAVDTSAATTFASSFLSPQSVHLYNRQYSAVGFFWQIGFWGGGDQAVWDRIPQIANQPDSPSAYEASLAGLPTAVGAVLASSSAQRPELGPAWTFSDPHGQASGRVIRIVEVSTAAGESTSPAGQALTQFEYQSPGDGPAVITTTHVGNNVLRWLNDPAGRAVLLTGDIDQHWCLNGPCTCEDGSAPFDSMASVPSDDPRLLVGLTGSANDGARFKTLIIDLEDACNPPTDGDLVGEWIADIDAIRDAFNEAYSLIDINVTGVSGEIRMSLLEDGVFILNYDSVRLTLDDEFVGEIIVNGAGEMTWSGVDGAVELSGGARFNLTIETPELGGPPIAVITDTLGDVDGTLTFDGAVDGNSMTVSNVEGSLAVVPPGQPNIIVFPTEWIRVG